MKKTRNDLLIILIFITLLSYFNYIYIMAVLPDHLSDFNGHTYVYLPLFFTRQTFWEGWMAVPYCAWHLLTLFFYKILLIPVDVSAVYSTCVFAAFTYLVFYWMLQKIQLRFELGENNIKMAFVAFCLCIANPLSAFWLDSSAFSMNAIYSPTYSCVRGFSLLCFCLVCDIWGKQRDPEYRGIFFPVENGLKKYYVCLSFVLFLSAMAKPTFAEAFIPAVALCMLVTWILRIRCKDGSAKPYFRHCLYTFYCAIPTLIYIFAQYTVYFLLGGSYGGEGGSLIITRFLEVWKMYSENVVLSIVFSLAFPLFMLLIDPSHFFKTDMGRLSLVCLVVGFFEAAFLGEDGSKLSYCNFMWPIMSAMLLTYMVSAMRLMVLEKKQSDTTARTVLLSIAWLLFCLHALAGILIFVNLA